jgi:hypothetical protein
VKQLDLWKIPKEEGDHMIILLESPSGFLSIISYPEWLTFPDFSRKIPSPQPDPPKRPKGRPPKQQPLLQPSITPPPEKFKVEWIDQYTIAIPDGKSVKMWDVRGMKIVVPNFFPHARGGKRKEMCAG